jgi:hypothetical protein
MTGLHPDWEARSRERLRELQAEEHAAMEREHHANEMAEWAASIDADQEADFLAEEAAKYGEPFDKQGYLRSVRSSGAHAQRVHRYYVRELSGS